MSMWPAPLPPIAASGRTRVFSAVLPNHCGANLDNFDPRIVEGPAADRPLDVPDYRGIDTSGTKRRMARSRSATFSQPFIRWVMRER